MEAYAVVQCEYGVGFNVDIEPTKEDAVTKAVKLFKEVAAPRHFDDNQLKAEIARDDYLGFHNWTVVIIETEIPNWLTQPLLER